MSGNKIFVDTNILLYLLKGDSTLETFLHGKEIYISFVTEMELLGFPNITTQEEQRIIHLLAECSIIDIDSAIKTRGISIRRTHKLKLPDSIVVASALHLGLPFITADKQLQRLENTLGLIIYEP